MSENTSDNRHPDMDYAQHDATWDNVMRLTKWGVGILVVLLIVLYFVVNP